MNKREIITKFYQELNDQGKITDQEYLSLCDCIPDMSDDDDKETLWNNL